MHLFYPLVDAFGKNGVFLGPLPIYTSTYAYSFGVRALLLAKRYAKERHRFTLNGNPIGNYYRITVESSLDFCLCIFNHPW